ncbi:major facilitator superfamily domain-containing protein [Aspergillus cavernicola]|uniref:Major facilitator superfamily domain-containing protein n=1 Tax=Aspergillus cavernicola TaxID=176166 RepID=A0ABR4HQC9_9EURO
MSTANEAGKPQDLFVEDVPTEAERKLDRETLNRLDLILMPMTLILYLLAWLDRANVGNARVAGLDTDLNLSDYQYKVAITVTYVPYILAELPSNLILKKIGPRILLPTLCTAWGLVTILQCKAHNFNGFVACRFFLGLCEGGLFPGIVLYLSGFYRRHELQVRIALFFSAASLSGAFSGLLAAAIQQMDGLRNLRGWQWIFILEGLFTVCFGLFSYAMLPNTPHSVMTFHPHHKTHCLARLQLDSNLFESDPITAQKILSVFKDLHVLLLSAILFASGTCLFGLAYFSPSIVQAMGYSNTRTQLMTVPPYAVAFVVTMLTAYYADRYRQRGLAALATTSIAFIGAIMTLLARSTPLRYAALILLVTGIYAAAPCLISWIPNNSAGHVRRATAVAIGFISTSSGGVMSTWIYPASSKPYYNLGARFNLALTAISLAALVAQILLLRSLNYAKVTRRAEILAGLEGLTPQEQFELLGDTHPDYRYTY